jgi:HSP20 family protein
MKLISCNPAYSRNNDLEEWLRASLVGVPALGRYLEPTAQNKPLVAEVDEDETNFYASFEVPGVKKENVKLDLNNRLLTVNVEKTTKRGENESSYTLTRSITVPDSVSVENIAAKLEDGILTVTLPKAEERKPRSITVS